MRDTIKNLRELQNMSDSERLRWGLMQAEGTLIQGMTEIQSEVQSRQGDDWPTREDLVEHLNSMDDHEQREQFERVMEQVEHDVAQVFYSWHEMALLGDGMDKFESALKSLIISLHSPVVQESLLLAVGTAYRPRVRDQFEQFGHLLWGWYEIVTGIDGEHVDHYLPLLAAYWEMDPDDLREMLFSDGAGPGQGQQPRQ